MATTTPTDTETTPAGARGHCSIWEGYQHVGAVLRVLSPEGEPATELDDLPEDTDAELAEAMGPELWDQYVRLRSLT